tara:strand:+ start:6022 stop:7248 length:1227 start_codon:yes stop_codon:yes gene_type:complete
MAWRVIDGDCLEAMAAMEPCSVDAIVCDPPYGLSPDGKARTWDDITDGRTRGGFMGKAWDAAVPGVTWALACLRVLKPGGHLVAFGGTRTIHRLACAIEDAGLEVRDTIAWQYWSGFPKSLDVSKAIDKAAGADREVVGNGTFASRRPRPTADTNIPGAKYGFAEGHTITAPATDDAKRWQGWGTALKPSFEPAILARKPLDGTVAANVLRWGTGALNIDGCRYAYGDPAWPGPQDRDDTARPVYGHRGLPGDQRGAAAAGMFGPAARPGMYGGHDLGRWPANVYACPKASRSEREAGCRHLPARSGADAVERVEGSAGMDNPRAGAGRTADEVRNYHPTVKPAALMAWLCRLVTPPGGVILDPFCGSGTTGLGALRGGFDFIGVELDPEYAKIARARIEGDAPLFNR